MQDNPKWRAIGAITRTHGLAGQVFVYPLTDFPERFKKGLKVQLQDTRGNVRPVVIEECSAFKNGFLVLFNICRSIEDAEDLKDMKLVVDFDDRMPMPDEDTFYIEDIVGLKVYTDDGRYLGVVSEVLPNPANDIYCIGDIMIPAVNEFILDVNLAEKTMLVRLIPGMLPEDE